MNKNDEITNFTLADYSVEELIKFKNLAIEKHDKLIEAWGEELGEIIKEKDFDQYSRKGERKLKKLNQKHAEPLADILNVIDAFDEELSKRENYNYQQSFINDNYKPSYNKQMTTEEFIRLEMEKIDRERKNRENN